MIRKFLILFFMASTLLACKENNEVDPEIQRLQDENKALNDEIATRDSTLKLFEESFTTIQRNLGLISEREREIAMRRELDEINLSRDEITKDIQAINNLLQENKNTIDNLRSQLKKSGADAAGFKRMIDQLSTDIQSKEEEIRYLKENLTAANFTIEILNEMLDSAEFRNEIQKGIIDMQYSELTTAYYAVGSFKDLRDNGVLTKDGTIIGLGGSKQLKDDFNQDYFAKININDFNDLSVTAKDIKIVTNHPIDSYTIENDGDKKRIKIDNPNNFWSISKYLVVETK